MADFTADKFFGGLGAIGAALQGRSMEYEKQQREREALEALKTLGPQLASGQVTPSQYLATLGQYDPSVYGKIALSQLGVDRPSSLQEWDAYQRMGPEERNAYLNMKRATQTINLGGTQAVLSPTGGIQESFPVTPKQSEMPEFRGAQAAAVEGAKLQTTKEAAAPAALARIDENIKIIDNALAQPGFDANFGAMGILPNRPGGDAADAASYLEQIRGTAFLTAIGELKGTGQISEREGEAATSAVTRLQKSQSPKAAREAMQDLKNVLEKARTRAAGGTSFEALSSPPKPQDAYSRELKLQRLQELRALKAQKMGGGL